MIFNLFSIVIAAFTVNVPKLVIAINYKYEIVFSTKSIYQRLNWIHGSTQRKKQNSRKIFKQFDYNCINYPAVAQLTYYRCLKYLKGHERIFYVIIERIVIRELTWHVNTTLLPWTVWCSTPDSVIPVGRTVERRKRV